SELWFNIRSTMQIYHLHFELKNLEEIYFENDSKTIIYTIDDVSYFHSIDPYLSYDQEFYAQPKLLTKDGFKIQISRQGEIVVSSTLNNELGMLEEKDIHRYTNLAKRLQVTLLFDWNDLFLYAGHKNTTNVLTNTQKRSILFGGEKNENGEDLVIRMQDYTERFPGNIILRNGTKYREQIHVIPDAVVMTIKSLDRSKRDLEVPDIPTYWLHPAPVVMSEAQLTILSMDDLEVGQQILLDDSQESFLLEAFDDRRTTLDQNLADTISIDLGAEEGSQDLWKIAELAAESGTDWEDVLEEIEDILLEGLPEVERQFRIPLIKKAWKRHRYLVVLGLTLVFGIFLIISVILIRSIFLKFKYTLVVNELGEKRKIDVNPDSKNEDDILLKSYKT
ncbi:hypothetical protein Fcan01_25379, partial [Folsomia candida]